jgi:F-type H+-transporting ATPase subunit gamma
MATALSDIKRRIGTTAQIRKVTSTLQKVASAKLVQEQRRIANADEYTGRLLALLKLADRGLPSGAESHPLMRPGQPGMDIALIVFGADRGLCGTFNTVLMKAVTTFREQHGGDTVHLLMSGKVPYNRAVRRLLAPLERVEQIEGLADRMMGAFGSGAYREVHLLYWDFITRGRQAITVQQILPVITLVPAASNAAIPAPLASPPIEPSAQALIDSLLPEYVRRAFHDAYHNSAAAEHAQRQISMSRAAENAGEMLNGLRKHYSRLRQENITTEMLEIVAGMYR